MEKPSFEQELEDRLRAIETGAAGAVTVPDLPLRDLILTVTALAIVIGALLWWAY